MLHERGFSLLAKLDLVGANMNFREALKLNPW